jgi:ATPase subunit of ABC transporter with duplicated ATPase domains
MLTAHHLSKTYGITPVLDDVSFNVNARERIGLVGPNGCGKTTLLRILAGLELPDSGTYQFNPPSLRIGYLPQGGNLPANLSLGEYIQQMQGNVLVLTSRLETVASKLTADPGSASLQQEYDQVLLDLADSSSAAARTPALLTSFGLDALPASLSLAALSGGQKTRLNLAGLLLQDPRLLLLDEPTNHLDPAMLEWLEDWLLNSRCGVLIVSHDRTFLDKVAHTTFEIDPRTHKLTAYAGNYSAYLAQKEDEQARQWQDYTDQQEQIRQLTDAARRIRGIAVFRKGGKADTGDKFAKGFFANRGLATIKRAKNIEARVERLLNENHIDKPRASWQLKMKFKSVPESGQDVLVLDHLTIGYGSPPVLSNLNAVIRYGDRVALSGENGCGKTTLLRTAVGILPPLSGRCCLGASVIPGFLTQEQENLRPEDNALVTLQRTASLPETDARAYLHKYLFANDEVFTPVKNLSWGQRVRLSLACLVAGGCNFLLLDEPLNHLDLPSRAQFERALVEFSGTILAVTHDRYFTARFATRMWQLDEGQLNDTTTVPLDN